MCVHVVWGGCVEGVCGVGVYLVEYVYFHKVCTVCKNTCILLKLQNY